MKKKNTTSSVKHGWSFISRFPTFTLSHITLQNSIMAKA